jgi:hypothetical protein
MTVKVYGPYEDKSKGGRKKMTIYNTETKKFKSTTAARYKKEKELGKKEDKPSLKELAQWIGGHYNKIVNCGKVTCVG